MRKLFRFLVFGFCLLAASARAADDSPLFEAVKKGDKGEVEALIAKGADVNAKDKDGLTPLGMAVGWRNKDIAELLLAKGADVNAKNTYGWTPLHLAMGAGKKDIAELLLAKGADVNAKDKQGWTPLCLAASANERKDLAELLLAKGADVNVKADSGWTPLYIAVHEGKKDVVELLLAKGADVNAKTNAGWTPLHEAAAWSGKKDKDIAELLLAKGADVNDKDKDGMTPLHLAMSWRNKEIAELLEEHMLKQARSNPRAAFVELTTRLKGSSPDYSTLGLIIKLASEIKPAPAIPEEARKHFVEGTAIVKAAKNPAQQALAVQSFGEALKIAPWWGDAYYNLGVALELAEKYDEAERAFNFYLLSNPGATEKREVQDRIYALGAKRKLSGAK